MENKELYFAEQFVLHTNRNIFLTGKAGTGKTTFLKEVLKKSKKNTVVVAPTGVAAINAGGVTIHSMFQLPTTSFIPTSDYINPDFFTNVTDLAKIQKLRKEKRKVLQELQLLVIDEISMVRADLLDAVDLTLRRVRKSGLAFGGVQVLAIGDLFQLAPVVREHTWNTLSNFYKSPFFFHALAWQRSDALSIELLQVYRQSDQKFIDILNRIRNGVKSDDDLDILNKQWDSRIDNEMITLTTHNKTANKINEDQLSKLDTPEITLEAKVTGRFFESSFPTQEKIVLKVGAQVMFIRNHPEGLYFNGKLGKLVGKTDELLKVKLADENKTIIVDKEEWKNTSYELNDTTKEIETKELGTFTQYPLRLAWAVTVHKSQGLTFDNLQLDLENSFAAGQLYVALSRCRSLEGLKLLTKLKSANVIVDNRILEFYNAISIDDTFNDQLEMAKINYANHQLRDTFTFNKYLDNIIEWQKYIVEKVDGEKGLDFLVFVKGLKTSFSTIINTAAKFQSQLTSMFIENDTVQISARAESAIRYFTDEINAKIILPIESHIDKYKSESDLRKHLKQLIYLLDDIWFLMNGLYNNKYLGSAVYKDEIKHKPSATVEFSKKKKFVKGDTFAQTLELFRSGKTIAQIAEIRMFSKGTIETHMLKHVKNKEVAVKELMKKQRYEKVLRYILNNEDKSLSELVNGSDLDIQYIEVRWIKAELELLNKES
jgi:ribosomal protein L21E